MKGRQVLILEESDFDKLVSEISARVIEAIKPQDSGIEKSISHKEAAAFLNIHRDTLTERIKNGTYPASIVHVNGSRREYYKSELKKLLTR